MIDTIPLNEVRYSWEVMSGLNAMTTRRSAAYFVGSVYFGSRSPGCGCASAWGFYYAASLAGSLN
ncbi:MAG TPA: hypothetical protein VJU86_10690 [Pyrinomonadaceae bacterium]|nr:hypothetical protein [Pyrinomonadaceae bacterium]